MNNIDGTTITDYIHSIDLLNDHISSMEFLLSNEGEINKLNSNNLANKKVQNLIFSFDKYIAFKPIVLKIFRFSSKINLHHNSSNFLKWKIKYSNVFIKN